MLLNLGRKQTPAPDDLVGLLLECHGRIRTFVRLARTVAAAPDAPAEAAGLAAGRVRRYFAEALPLHVADEEQSVEPRLRGRDAALDRALGAMRREHAEHEAATARLVELCALVEADPAQLAGLAGELGALAARLDALFEAHLEAEERSIFPALGALLGEAERRAAIDELRARRRPPA